MRVCRGVDVLTCKGVDVRVCRGVAVQFGMCSVGVRLCRV